VTQTVYFPAATITTSREFRPREKDDWYETEQACLRAFYNRDLFDIDAETSLLDPSAGRGVYGKVWEELFPFTHRVVGVELKEEFEATPDYSHWATGDFLTLPHEAIDPTDEGFDHIHTNPPYKHAEAFFFKALEYAKPTATIVFLLRLGFLASESRFHSMWQNNYAPSLVTVLNTRPSFTGDGKTYPGEFCFIEWRRTNGIFDNAKQLSFSVYERDGKRKGKRTT
jgi:hypothetical protein